MDTDININELGRPTIFLDMDGTLIKHRGTLQDQITLAPELLPGVRESLARWDMMEAIIIVATGRRESMRVVTENQLRELGVVYDYLIMGLGRGARVIVNDRKPDSDIDTVGSYCMKRNTGLVECPF